MTAAKPDLPKLSVVIVAHNAAPTLAQSLESVLGQDAGQISSGLVEVLVVNDASTDDTLSLLANYPSVRSAEVSLRCVGKTRNAAVSLARGQYIAFLDADDLLMAGSLTAILKTLQKNPDAVFTPLREFRGEVPKEFFSAADLDTSPLSQARATRLFLDHRDLSGHLIGKVFRREILVKHPLPELACYEDMAWIPECISVARHLELGRRPFYFYRKTSGSLSDRDDWLHIPAFLEALARMDKAFGEARYQSLRDAHWIKLASDLLHAGAPHVLDKYPQIRERIQRILPLRFYLDPSVRFSRKRMFWGLRARLTLATSSQ